jgi:DNA primase
VPPSTAQKHSLAERLSRYERNAPEKLLPYLTGRGLGVPALEQFRLGYVEPSELDPKHYWHRMAIPYLTPTGVVQIRYRCLLDHHSPGGDPGRCPKFMGDAGQEVTLYNAHATLRSSPVVFLTEGEPDVWAVQTLTGYPAVGIPGAKSWVKHPYWARVFVGFDQIVLPADGDDAGQELAETVSNSLPEVRIVRLPDGEDANSVLARDPDEFLRRCGLAA